jgi:hypothetical protein
VISSGGKFGLVVDFLLHSDSEEDLFFFFFVGENIVIFGLQHLESIETQEHNVFFSWENRASFRLRFSHYTNPGWLFGT